MEMIIHKTGRELNRGGLGRAGCRKAALRSRRMAGAACIVAGLACTGCFLLPAEAAPATLKSPDATVYEQADEDSNAVGSLVEGSSFEYTGDVTAEDGSVWHQVTTANGATGYIRGDRELELREEEPAPEGREGQNGPEEDGGDTAPAENEPTDDGAAGENAGEAAGGAEEETSEGNAPEGSEDEETPEEGGGEDPGDDDAVAAARSLRNDQAKKYVMDSSMKVKERGSLAGTNTGVESVKSKKAGADTALIIGMAVVFCCIGTIILCLSGIRKLKWETGAEVIWDPAGSRAQRKTEKKKHSQKRKAKKSKRLQGRQQ